MAAGSDRSIPAAQPRCVETERAPAAGDAASSGRLRDIGQAGHVHPETETAPR